MWFYKPSKHSKFETGAKITAPDTDNLVKLLKDCMTKCGFWLDDAQVTDETIIKRWDDRWEGIMVTLGAYDAVDCQNV